MKAFLIFKTDSGIEFLSENSGNSLGYFFTFFIFFIGFALIFAFIAILNIECYKSLNKKNSFKTYLLFIITGFLDFWFIGRIFTLVIG